MDEQLTTIDVQKKRFGITASCLKWIAIILMTINHFSTLPIFSGEIGEILNYGQMFITRISYPIFAFLIAEGMVHTKHRQKYLLRLLIFAIISQPIYGWALMNNPMAFSLNVFFDLLSGAVAIEVYDQFFKKSKITFFVLIIAICALSVTFAFGYNILAVLLTLIFYVFREKKLLLSIAVLVGNPLLVFAMYYLGYGMEFGYFSVGMISEFFIVACLPLVLLYNGEKGKQLPKWFFYGYYPVHLLIIALLKTFVF